MLAYDYPLLGLFWTMLIFFLWFAWLMVVFNVLVDVFRSDDMGGFAKAAWTLFVLIVPLVGVLVYLVARGDGMRSRRVEEVRTRQAEFDSYVRDVSSSTGVADELAKLGELRDSGVITAEEFDRQKSKLLV